MTWENWNQLAINNIRYTFLAAVFADRNLKFVLSGMEMRVELTTIISLNTFLIYIIHKSAKRSALDCFFKRCKW